MRSRMASLYCCVYVCVYVDVALNREELLSHVVTFQKSRTKLSPLLTAI